MPDACLTNSQEPFQYTNKAFLYVMKTDRYHNKVNVHAKSIAL